MDEDSFDDLNMDSNYLYKDDFFSLTKPGSLSLSSGSPTLSTNTVNTITNTTTSVVNNNNNNIVNDNTEDVHSQVEVKMNDITYTPSTLSSAKLITLTAPIQPIINHQLPTQVALAPVYNIQMQPINTFIQNGQIARKSAVITETTPVVATTMTISTSTEKPEKKYSCETCNKSFSTIYNKRRHDDMFHNSNAQSQTEFKCSSCDKVFTSIYNKNRHENIHKPIVERLKYKCIINNCNRGFTTQFILKMHIKKVHNLEVNW